MAKAAPSDIKPGAEVARELGIYLGQLYGWERKGLNIHHTAPANAKSKSKTWVSLSEAQAFAGTIKHKAPKHHADGTEVPKGPKAKSVKAPTRAKVKAGDIVSWDRGHVPGYDEKGHSVAVVTGQTGRIVHLEGQLPLRGGHNFVFTTESLAHRMAKGLVKLETPESVLGMVVLQWIRDAEDDLAISLASWADANGVDIIVPELIETSAEDIQYSDEDVAVGDDD